MSRTCEVCGKQALKTNKRCFSNKANRYFQIPNLQSVKITLAGVVKRAKVCTSCLKAGKVQKVY